MAEIIKFPGNIETLDAHTHPVFTPGEFKLKDLVDVCISNGVSCIGITNFPRPGKPDFRYLDFSSNLMKPMHNRNGRSYEVVAKQAGWFAVSRKIDGVEDIVQFYQGQEVPTEKGHILFFDLPRQIPINKPTSMEEAIKMAKDQDAVVIADHPYTEVWGGMGKRMLDEHLDEFDAIEWNAQCINLLPDKYKNFVMSMFSKKIPFRFLRDAYQERSNILAEVFAEIHKKPLIATSDTHMSRLLGIGGNASQIGLGSISFENPNGKGNRLESGDLRQILSSENYRNHMVPISRKEFLKWAIPNRLNALLEICGLPSGEY